MSPFNSSKEGFLVIKKQLHCIKATLFILLSVFCSSVISEPTSNAVTLTYVRPYAVGDVVFIGANMPAGSFCSYPFFSINISTNSGKAMYAAALVALSQKKYVYIEINECGNGEAGSNLVQSIYVLY
ncbi:hypothetical protein [Pseudorhodoferax sp.]|uniref:hypothetical protein n=1 Tax=Pseudorhodoferax sp. TaxID=1993553 RepID=UPI0039E5D123